MPRTATTRSDVLEKEYEAGSAKLIRWTTLFFVCLLLLYFFHFIPDRPLRIFSMIVAGGLSLTGLILAIQTSVMMRKTTLETPIITVNCPYCDFAMQFPERPTVDWDCESCHRRVQYENGVAVPVKDVTCTFCRAQHKVSVKARQYLCDKCNRALKLGDANNAATMVTEQSDVMQNYDVLLTDIGRKRNEVALALESILICNLVEARRQMENLPLTVTRNVPERKADAIRRRLRDLGATAIVRVTESSEQSRPGRY